VAIGPGYAAGEDGSEGSRRSQKDRDEVIPGAALALRGAREAGRHPEKLPVASG